jgi:glucose/arabinose dehydrogenase
MAMFLKIFFLIILLTVFPRALLAQIFVTNYHKFSIEELLSNLNHPWSLAFVPDEGILISERRGKLWLFPKGQDPRIEIKGLPKHLAAGGQGGLLEIAIPADFSQTRRLYFSFVGEDSLGRRNTELARAILARGSNTLEAVTVIFRAEPKTRLGNAHFGGKIAFAPDGSLFLSLGDRYTAMQEAQNPKNHLGTIIRLLNDQAHPDNPFADGKKGDPFVFSFGHRNVQGLLWHPNEGALWAHEHGPKGGDEVNRIVAGGNYGWPKVTYGIDYSGAIISELTTLPGMRDPLHYWVPSIAPSGFAYYQGEAFPQWQGDLLVGALRGALLARLRFQDDKLLEEERLLENRLGRIREVRIFKGLIYLLTDSANGSLFVIKPSE